MERLFTQLDLVNSGRKLDQIGIVFFFEEKLDPVNRNGALPHHAPGFGSGLDQLGIVEDLNEAHVDIYVCVDGWEIFNLNTTKDDYLIPALLAVCIQIKNREPIKAPMFF